MKKKHTMVVACAGLFLSVTCSALAQEKACLMEGSFSIGGQITMLKDCLENNGIPHERFTESCESLAQAPTAFGSPPAKVTYMKACPLHPQGSCQGLFGSPLSGYYYKRDVASLPSVKESCQAQGGVWR